MRFKKILHHTILICSLTMVLDTPSVMSQERFTFPTNQLGDEDDEKEKIIWRYDPKYRPQTHIKNGNSRALISNAEYTIHFVRKKTLKPDEVALRFSQPVITSGCAKIIAPKANVKNSGIIQYIEIGRPIIALDKTVRYAHIDCRQVPNIVQTDVVLKRKELIENNVKRISIKSDFGTEDYQLEIGKNTLALKGKTGGFLFKPNGKIRHKDPLLHYFYPKNTIILSVPRAMERDKINLQLKNIALQKGLVPLKTVIKNFASLNRNSKDFYFLDQSGITISRLSHDQNMYFGKIALDKKYLGPNGEYTEKITKNVYARLPGDLD